MTREGEFGAIFLLEEQSATHVGAPAECRAMERAAPPPTPLSTAHGHGDAATRRTPACTVPEQTFSNDPISQVAAATGDRRQVGHVQSMLLSTLVAVGQGRHGQHPSTA